MHRKRRTKSGGSRSGKHSTAMKEARELGAIEKEDEEAGTLPLRTPLIELLYSRLPEGVYNSDNIWDMGVDGSVATQESFLAWCDQNYIYEDVDKEDPKEQEGSDKNDSPTRSPKRALEEEEATQKENRRDEHENNDNGKLTVHWQGHRRAGDGHRHQRHTRGRGCSCSSGGSHTAESTQEAKQSVRSAGTVNEGGTKTRNSRGKRNRDSKQQRCKTQYVRPEVKYQKDTQACSKRCSKEYASEIGRARGGTQAGKGDCRRPRTAATDRTEGAKASHRRYHIGQPPPGHPPHGNRRGRESKGEDKRRGAGAVEALKRTSNKRLCRTYTCTFPSFI